MPPARLELLPPAPLTEQGAFAFLAEVPQREVRRAARARQPHLRGRTPPVTGDAPQLLLPLPASRPTARTGSLAAEPAEAILNTPPLPASRPKARKGLLEPELAEAMEAALREARGQPEGSRRQRAAEESLLMQLRPWLRAEARRDWESHERTFLSRADLEQEAALRAQKLWRGFTPGQAGPGRTLYPAYVVKAVRQHLGRVLADGRLVGPTDHGRKLASRARKYAAREGVEYEEALVRVGADGPTALALAQGATRCEEREAEALEDTGAERRAELTTEGAALAALQRLPRLQRLAVATHVGLARERRSDKQLAAHLQCTLAELLEARAAGLAELRAQVGAC